jgi:glucose-6-phosphate isomerase
MYAAAFETLNLEADRVMSAPVDSEAAAGVLNACGLSLDLSRQWLDEGARAALQAHAVATGFDMWRAALADDDIVNVTESQAATHMQCRAALAPAANPTLDAEWVDLYTQRANVFLSFADDFRAGKLKGATGQTITHYVHLGIGGSDLGPRCVVQALDGLNGLDWADSPARGVRLVANLDPDDFAKAVRGLNPATTLFGIASKSFSTLETQANANLAKAWLKAGLSTDDLSQHFCAMSAAPDKAAAFMGFNDAQMKARIFAMAQTVGGRYSLWSCIGLPIAMAFGRETFAQLCEGAALMDAHFLTAPFADNLPAQLGAVQVWNASVLGLRVQPTIAYSERLALLPAHLQQVDMESNGKLAGRDGEPVAYPTAPALLAGVGTQTQHAFFQWMHQGTDDIASVFIGVDAKHHQTTSPLGKLAAEYAHDVSLCMHAQADVLWDGGETTKAGVFGQHGVYPGGRPVAILTLNGISPRTVGATIAAFEHAVYTAAVMWGINPFDQWGVELGKQMYAAAKNKPNKDGI